MSNVVNLLLFLSISILLHLLAAQYYFEPHKTTTPYLSAEIKPRLAVNFISQSTALPLKNDIEGNKTPPSVIKKPTKPSNKKEHKAPEQAVVKFITPHYKKQVQPHYPKRARQLGQQGKVTLQIKISAQGVPIQVEVKKSSGYHMLDAAGVLAAQQSLFDMQGAKNEAYALISFDFHFAPQK